MLTQDYLSVKTPAYIFHTDALTEWVAQIRQLLGEKIRLVYAAKANPFLLRPLLPLVDGYELCSPGEARLAKKFNLPADKLVFSGVNKKRQDIEEALCQAGEAAVYTVESVRQMELLEQAAHERGLHLQVLLRVTTKNQFGMDEETVAGLIDQQNSFPHLHIKGLQMFGGTQKKEKRTASELAQIDAFIQKLRTEHHFEVKELEFGPGLYVPYFEGEDDETALRGLRALREMLGQMAFSGTVTLEMGRFIAANCGCYVTQIDDVKKNGDVRYALCDGGIHQLTYYGQMMAMKTPHIRRIPAGQPGQDDPPDIRWTVCGSLCTTSDILVRDCPLGNLSPGDRLVFARAGAYSVTEGISLFLCRDLPSVYLSEAGKLRLVRPGRGTEEIVCP